MKTRIYAAPVVKGLNNGNMHASWNPYLSTQWRVWYVYSVWLTTLQSKNNSTEQTENHFANI